MGAELVVAGIQLVTLILQSIQQYQEGKLSEEELLARWKAMKLDLAIEHAKAVSE